MRARPRTWPPTRLSRLRLPLLLSLAMPSIYPPRVSVSRSEFAMSDAHHDHSHAGHDHHHGHHHGAPPDGGAIHPVCGMTVDPHNPTGGKADYRGHPYYFCSAGCRTKFVAAPGNYLGERAPETVVASAVY